MRHTVAIIGVLLGALFVGSTANTAPAASAQEIRPLLIGTQVPEVKLRSADDGEFELNQAVAAKPTILIFYRGGW